MESAVPDPTQRIPLEQRPAVRPRLESTIEKSQRLRLKQTRQAAPEDEGRRRQKRCDHARNGQNLPEQRLAAINYQRIDGEDERHADEKRSAGGQHSEDRQKDDATIRREAPPSVEFGRQVQCDGGHAAQIDGFDIGGLSRQIEPREWRARGGDADQPIDGRGYQAEEDSRQDQPLDAARSNQVEPRPGCHEIEGRWSGGHIDAGRDLGLEAVDGARTADKWNCQDEGGTRKNERPAPRPIGRLYVALVDQQRAEQEERNSKIVHALRRIDGDEGKDARKAAERSHLNPISTVHCRAPQITCFLGAQHVPLLPLLKTANQYHLPLWRATIECVCAR